MKQTGKGSQCTTVAPHICAGPRFMIRIYFTALCIFCFSNSNAQSKDYSCRILDVIINDMYREQNKIQLLHNTKDIGQVEYPDGSMGIFNNSNYPKHIVDSIIIALDSFNVMEDNFFLFKDTILLIDTFIFFTNRCEKHIRDNIFIISNDYSKKQASYNKSIIELLGFGTYKEHFIMYFKSIDSKDYIQFYFSLFNDKIHLVKKRWTDPNEKG